MAGLSNMEKQIENRKKKTVGRRVFSFLAAIVVFCTTYALILPAITLEKQDKVLDCPYKVHEHDKDCYNKDGELICGKADYVVHVHNEDCYDSDGNLVCTLPEIEPHEHTEDCFLEEEVLTCTKEESEGHIHSNDCYSLERGELICTESTQAHQHDDSCYAWTQAYVCGQVETEDGHQHTDACIGEERGELICTESTKPHQHTDDCYAWNEVLSCGKSEGEGGHQHNDSCYEIQKIPICGELELHKHTEYCEKNGCDKIELLEHVHGDGCFREEKAEEPSDETAENIEQAESETIDIDSPDSSAETAPQEAEMSGEKQTENTDKLSADDASADGLSADVETEDTDEAGAEDTDVQEEAKSVSVLSDEDTGAFTYLSAGLQASLTLTNSNYKPNEYELVVDSQDRSYYSSALESFTSHGQVIEDAVIYKIYLKNKTSGQEITNLNAPYSLTMNWSGGLFTEVNASDTLDFTYCKNQGSEPTKLNNCQVTYGTDGNVTALTAEDSYYPNSCEFVFVRTSTPNGLTAGNFDLKYNKTKDAFLSDSAYSKYYNSNSPIGTAGSFHIVAFEEAHLNAHTNGNVLAKKLYAGSNFGTSNFDDELSYIQNYEQVHATSASSADHTLVIGSDNSVAFADNGNAFSVNGTKIDKPNHLIQDVDTASAPFIDLNRVKEEIKQISVNLNKYGDTKNLSYQKDGDYSKLTLTDASGVGVIHYNFSELSEKLGNYVQIDGFKSGANGTVVVDVDCSGAKEINMPQARIVVDGQIQDTTEVTEFSAGKVIWNFVNAEGVTINTHLTTGIILAPGATVNINQNLNGTVVADYINVNAESHRTDFTGKIKNPGGDVIAGEYYVTVHKIETGYAGSALPGAEFDLYQWDNNKNDWTQVNTESLKTGDDGTVILHNLEVSVAYKLKETKAPSGYALKNGEFNFWVRNDKNQTKPTQAPEDFSGSAVEVGGTLLAANDKIDTGQTTSLTIKKEWYASDGTTVLSDGDINVDSITATVYRITDGNTETKQLYQTLELKKDNGWTDTLSGLPLAGTDSDGKTVQYTYTVEEVAVTGYQVSYQRQDNMITITNTKGANSEEYVLPETGGTGTHPYTAAGLLIITGAVCLMLNQYLRRKEGF